jgi:hypothetical protein
MSIRSFVNSASPAAAASRKESFSKQGAIATIGSRDSRRHKVKRINNKYGRYGMYGMHVFCLQGPSAPECSD